MRGSFSIIVRIDDRGICVVQRDRLFEQGLVIPKALSDGPMPQTTILEAPVPPPKINLPINSSRCPNCADHSNSHG
jgi:hypothetical protein